LGIEIYFFKLKEIETIQEHKAQFMKHKIPTNCPKDGQFVAVWEHDNKIWAGTYKWKELDLYEYSKRQDTFTLVNNESTAGWMQPNTNVNFYITRR